MNPNLTREWAKAQERVFGDLASAASLREFDLLCAAQEFICPTNLTFRQRVAAGQMEIADRQFNQLHRNGYWIEGKSYCDYAAAAMDWYVKLVDDENDIANWLEGSFNGFNANYAALAFPDGGLPLPEVSADVRLPFDPLTMADNVDTSSYRVKRWFAPDRSECLAQLLVCKDANPEPRANLHYHLAAGYFALWIKGRGYIERVAPYEGFDLARNTASDDVADRLPRGALPPTWRLAPPTVGCDFTPEMATFVWTRKDGNETMVLAERQITWDAASVTVRDNGATRRYDIPQ